MNAVTVATFDYAGLPVEIATAAKRSADDIRKLKRRATGDIIAIGNALRAVKAKLDHGQFLHWIEAEVNINTRSAQNYMRAAEWSNGKYETVSHLEPTTIYLLSSPSTPEIVEQEVLRRVASGAPIATDAVKAMVADAKAEEKRSAEMAKLSPKQRKLREQQRIEIERQREAAQAKHQQQKAAAASAVALLVEKLGADFAEFARLLPTISHYFIDAIQKAASQGGAT